jgi:hypothetical protein
MRSHRLTITGALWALVLAVSALAPTASLAGPLLSGYGGPGVGNQAILGSALLNGPSSGGGAGGEGSAGGATTPTGAGLEAGTQATQRARRGAPTGSGKQSKRSAGKASSARPRARLTTSAAVSSRERAGGTQAPVLSAATLLYVLLALGVLVLTGAFTRGLTRQPG